MLVGNNEIVSAIIPEIRRAQPKSILDIGCGAGAWGILCRAFLQWHDDSPFAFGNFDPVTNGREIIIDGIESNPALSQAVPSWVYDGLSNDNEITALSNLSRQHYDLVIALSIIECITPDADLLINELLRIGKKVIVAVPKIAPPPKYDDVHPDGSYGVRPDHYLMGKGFNKFVPNPQLWIAVRDPSISGVAQVKKQELAAKRAQGSIVAARSPSIEPRGLEGREQILESLDEIKAKLGDIAVQQRIARERLGVSGGIRAIVRTVRRLTQYVRFGRRNPRQNNQRI